MPGLKITWTNIALRQMNDAIAYIQQDSINNGLKVYAKVSAQLALARVHPKMNPPDKYKINNDGSYRALVLYRYRIIYRIKNEELLILRVRHASMVPIYY